MSMQPDETRAILTLCLLASFADGEKHARERDEIKRVAQGFSQDEVGQLSTLYQDVLLKRVTLADVIERLRSAEAKQLGYEMAVCVCDADGTLSDAEQRFLAETRVALGLDASAAAAFVSEAQAIAGLPVSSGQAAGPAMAAHAAVDEAALDDAILNAAIVNGALELLPETLSDVHPKWKTPHKVTISTGLFVAIAAALFPVGQLADISNSGTLFAFFMVALAVLILRIKDPKRHRPFRTPLVWIVAPLAAAGTVFLFVNLPFEAKMVLPVWGGIGLVLYFIYGFRKSHLGRGAVEVHEVDAGLPPKPVPPIKD